MKRRLRVLLVLISSVALTALAGAVLLHSPVFQRFMAGVGGGVAVHGGGPAAVIIGEAGGDPAAIARARAGVAELGRRWDEAAYARTVALYTEVHRSVDWPGVRAPESYRYGADARQTLELYRPEQGFSEPGPVFLFLNANGLGDIDRVVAGSDGLMYGHLGKLAATAGGIGVSMSYRGSAESDARAMLANGAEDLRLALEWIVANVAAYGGDPGTIVVVANSTGATITAAYLFNEQWQMQSGHGVAAAVLSSGRFGALAPSLERLVIDYVGEPAALALWRTEYDTDEITAGVDDLHELLCRKYEDCPSYERIEGHNHVSQIMSLGTADTDVMNRLIRFYHTVR